MLKEDFFYFQDFTEDNYRNILKIAKSQYSFISFCDYKQTGKNLLMRHDIDFSIHRANKLAQIEAEEGILSTFFLFMHSPYYNLFEKEIVDLVAKIIHLGHDIGLHFDLSIYEATERKSRSFMENLSFEKGIIERFFGVQVRSFSFHNPTEIHMELYCDEEYHGMINVYSSFFKNNYKYCSDSNGYWRYDRLEDILFNETIEKLHILLHPEWWVPRAMSPNERISRCIEGRAKKCHAQYDKMLEDYGRLNVR